MSSSLCFVKTKQTDVLNEMRLTYDGTLTNKGYYFTAKMIVKVRIIGIKSSHRMCSMKKAIFKNFAIFTGKHLFWSLFLIKLHAWRKKMQVFSCGYCEIFKKTYIEEHLWMAASGEFMTPTVLLFSYWCFVYFIHVYFEALELHQNS